MQVINKQPVNTKLKIYAGDTFNDVWTLKLNGSPVDLTGATALMQFRGDANATSILFEMKTSDSTIVLGGAAGTITFNKVIPSNLPELFYYDFQITYSGGVVETLIGGEVEYSMDVSR